MIKIQKQQDTSTAGQLTSTILPTAIASSAVRAASASELTKYEKNKLAGIEAQAQQNKIEAIRINGTRIKPEPNTKTVDITIGDLAFKSAVTANEIDSNELFFIKCELD
jgi:hypothetical protein